MRRVCACNMENYEKAETVEKELDHLEPFQKLLHLPKDTLVVKVRAGSKIQTLLDVALGGMADRQEKPANRSVIFYGSGPAINKAVSCVEIFKRRIRNLQQINKLSFEEVEEIWNPKLEGLNVLKVSRKIPVLHVLLSLEQLANDEPGYQ